MCGRTACTLAPDEIIGACTYTDKNGNRKQPQWIDASGGQKYWPSYNKAPSSYTPVLTSGKHFDHSFHDSKSDRVVTPMKWGMTPSWHQGDPFKIPYETNNCRAEGMLEKKTYKVPLKKGFRCVILADGFFEWKTTKDGKQPYFFYLPQPDTVQFPFRTVETALNDSKLSQGSPKKELEATHEPDFKLSASNLKVEHLSQSDNEDSREMKIEVQEGKDLKVENLQENPKVDVPTWNGPRLLPMAGVFDIWKPHDGSPPLYSYSIITVSSSSDMDWCHHRMPAILTSEQEIQDWIDFSTIPLEKATSLIKPQKCLSHHPVSTAVNSSRYHAPNCVTPVVLGKPKSNPSSNLMMNWLKSGSPAKKMKLV
ncbi:unnamed protein product [Lymnaea stagnalis]|uniref:Abasic site processing protein HMCES n=1 Tax=Lymnaea stagnalis TaxID=6523 RepID=A0AAV2IGU5_LYMST